MEEERKIAKRKGEDCLKLAKVKSDAWKLMNQEVKEKCKMKS